MGRGSSCPRRRRSARREHRSGVLRRQPPPRITLAGRLRRNNGLAWEAWELRASRRECSSFRHRMWLGQRMRALPRSSGARVRQPTKSKAPEIPSPCPRFAASTPPSRPRRHLADVGQSGAMSKSSSEREKRPRRGSQERAQRWPVEPPAAPHQWASASRHGKGVRATRAQRARRGQCTRWMRTEPCAQRSRNTSREPVIRARSRYLSLPSAMRRCLVAIQFLGLRSRARLKG